MLLNCGVGEDSWEYLGLQWDPTSPSQRRSVLGVHWKDWCWRWNSNTLATWCEELTHLKRHWCWARLRAGGEGDDRGWNGWMASLTQWTWVWVNSGSWWWTGRPGVLQSMGSQRVGHDWATELNWTELRTWKEPRCPSIDEWIKKVWCIESEVAWSRPTLGNPMDCSLPHSSVHGILQTRVLEWVVVFFSRGSSQPRDRTQVSCIVGRCFTIWVTREVMVHIYNEILLSHKKEGIWVSSNEMDDHSACYTE